MKKTFLKVIGILALIDITDITAKGWVLYWMDIKYPEAASDYRNIEYNTILFRIRPKMINRVADYLEWVFASLETL